AAALEVLGIAIARGEEKQSESGELALSIVRNIPAETRIADGTCIRRGACLQFLGRPIGEGRHDIAEGADESVAFADDFVDFRTFHGHRASHGMKQIGIWLTW